MSISFNQTPQMKMMSNRAQQWADLPKDLLELIGERLDSRTDVYRFRAVCSSWRSSVPPSFKQTSPTSHILLKIPHPINAKAFLSQATICSLQLSHQDNPCIEFEDEEWKKSCRKSHMFPENNSTQTEIVSCSKVAESTPTAAAPSVSWLTKLQTTRGEPQLVSPFSNTQIASPCPRKLNMLDFKLVELSNTYSLKLESGCCVFGIDKVVLLGQKNFSHYVVFDLLVIYQGGKLAHWKTGDEKWTSIDEQNPHYHDILLYKDRPYVVDKLGTVSWINLSLELIPSSTPLFGYGTHKYNLVESCGDLYVVDRQLDRDEGMTEHEKYYYDVKNQNFRPIFGSKTIDVMVFKLDQDLGTWADARSLDNRVFVVGNECCFSANKYDFRWREGNCVYFIDAADEIGCHGELSGCNVRVYNLKDDKISKVASSPESFHIFWPPMGYLLGSNPSFFGNTTGYLQYFLRKCTPLFKGGIFGAFNY